MMRRPKAFGKPAPPSDKPLRHLARAKELGLTEKHVQETVTQFLELDGWRAIRTDPVSDRSRGKGFGEVGMPDYLYVRYNEQWMVATLESAVTTYRSQVELLWCEFKRPGAKPRPDQLAWHEAERARGALVLVVSDIDDFMRRWYPESGLQRRPAVR